MPSIGCDPELFIRSKSTGEIVPSKQIIPADGLKVNSRFYKDEPSVVRDGLQAEIHTRPFFCRAEMGEQIAAVIQKLAQHCEKNDCYIDWNPVVRIEPQKMDPEDLVLGCMPSQNCYGLREMLIPVGYRVRSAGGHFHFGSYGLKVKSYLVDPIIRTLDMQIGIPSVILDRHPMTVERRKLYGRAGEFRLPPHGLEYRTSSNFWLRSYQLFSMMMQLGRSTISRFDGFGVYNQINLAKLIPSDQVEQVINSNDLDGAKELWTWWTSRQESAYFNRSHTQAFTRFLFNDGLARFEEDPVTNWSRVTEQNSHSSGGETFLRDNYGAS